MILLFRTVILRNGHAVRSHIPGNGPLLLNVGNFKGQVRHAMAERRFQILPNGIAPVNGFVMWRKVNGVGSISSYHFVQLSCTRNRSWSGFSARNKGW